MLWGAVIPPAVHAAKTWETTVPADRRISDAPPAEDGGAVQTFTNDAKGAPPAKVSPEKAPEPKK